MDFVSSQHGHQHHTLRFHLLILLIVLSGFRISDNSNHYQISPPHLLPCVAFESQTILFDHITSHLIQCIIFSHTPSPFISPFHLPHYVALESQTILVTIKFHNLICCTTWLSHLKQFPLLPIFIYHKLIGSLFIPSRFISFHFSLSFIFHLSHYILSHFISLHSICFCPSHFI